MLTCELRLFNTCISYVLMSQCISKLSIFEFVIGGRNREYIRISTDYVSNVNNIKRIIFD